MTLFDVVIAALLQGVAQVLPLGAQGHLLLFGMDPWASPARLAVAAAGNVGAALAIALYFWRDIGAMGLGLARLFKGRLDPGGRLLLLIAAGTIPALGLGWLFVSLAAGLGGGVGAAAAMLVFGLFLLAADHLGVTVRRVEHLSWVGALAIGVLQAAALIPGISRTGIAITAARLMGFERADAARFALLLGLPAFLAYAGWSAATLSRQAELILGADLAVAAAASCVGALGAISIMMAWVGGRTFVPFALWRVLLGGGALVWAWWA